MNEDISTTLLEELLISTSSAQGSSKFIRLIGEASTPTPYDLTWSARKQKLLVTLASAWATDGRAINPALAYEVAFHQLRAERYGALFEALREEVDTRVIRFKGAEIAYVYPPGWVRRTGDLDLVASSPGAAIAIGHYLTGQGWRVIRLTVIRIGGADHVALNITRPSPDPTIADADWVQLGSFSFRGDAWRFPTRVRLPAEDRLSSQGRTIVALAEELSQRAMMARDVLDLTLSLRVLPDDQDEPVATAVGELALWPKLRGAFDQIDEPLAAQRAARLAATGHNRVNAKTLTARGARAAWSAAGRATAVAALEPLVSAKPLVGSRLARRARRLIAPAAMLEAGMPISGLPQADNDPPDELVIEMDARNVVARTPFGSCDLVFHGTI